LERPNILGGINGRHLPVPETLLAKKYWMQTGQVTVRVSMDIAMALRGHHRWELLPPTSMVSMTWLGI
jgi:hypothetical protein